MAGVHWWSYNGHKPGQTSCTDFRDEIQTDCNFETHIFRCSHHLGHSYSCSITVFSKPLYNSLAWPNRYTHVLNSFICILYKDFPHTSSSGPSTRSCSTRTTGAGGINCVLSSKSNSNNFLNWEWIIIVTVACMEYNWSFSLLKFVVKFWKSMLQMTYEQCSQTVILAHVLTDKRAYAIFYRRT